MEAANIVLITAIVLLLLILLIILVPAIKNNITLYSNECNNKWNKAVNDFKNWLNHEIMIANGGTTSQLKESINRLKEIERMKNEL